MDKKEGEKAKQTNKQNPLPSLSPVFLHLKTKRKTF